LIRSKLKIQLKSIINRTLKRRGEKNKEDLISIKTESKPKGNVLVSYVIDPFILKQGESISNTHTNHWESHAIVHTFLELGYNVDIVDYDNFRFIPQKNYNVFLSARTNLQRIAGYLKKDCIKIAHIDMAHWITNNLSAYRRLKALQERKGITLTNIKFAEINWAIEHADYAIVLGNQFTIDTYRYANKPIYRVPISTCERYPYQRAKNFDKCRNNFLWFGSHGFVHKGLDLVLEAFADMPDYNLYVYGPVDDEKEFSNVYYKELNETPNIHSMGWVDVSSDDFIDALTNCVAVVYPSCAEGGGGSVINCMHAGLIPIVSYESSVDVGAFGWILDDSTAAEIKKAVKHVANLPTEELQRMSLSSWEFVNANHTRETFAHEFRCVIEKIIRNES